MDHFRIRHTGYPDRCKPFVCSSGTANIHTPPGRSPRTSTAEGGRHTDFFHTQNSRNRRYSFPAYTGDICHRRYIPIFYFRISSSDHIRTLFYDISDTRRYIPADCISYSRYSFSAGTEDSICRDMIRTPDSICRFPAGRNRRLP